MSMLVYEEMFGLTRIAWTLPTLLAKRWHVS